jgi:hypothetical protein
MEEAGVAAVTRQVHLALFTDAMLDIEAFVRMSSARRWRPGTADTFFPPPDDAAGGGASQKGQPPFLFLGESAPVLMRWRFAS